MRTEIKLLMDKQGAGGALHTEEIRALMIYALELLKEFEQLTLERMKMKVDWDELKRLHAASKQGEWSWYYNPKFSSAPVSTLSPNGVTINICNVTIPHIPHKSIELCEANAAWIAAIHNAFPAIIARLEAAQTIPPGYALVRVEQVKDAERLDFLDGNLKFSMGWQVNKAPVGNVGVHSIIFAGRLPVTIREAIDKAMLTAAKGE